MMTLVWLLIAMWIGVLCNIGLGIAKNIFTMKLKWNWNKFLRGIVKGLLISGAVFGLGGMFAIIESQGFAIEGLEGYAPVGILLAGIAYQISTVGSQLIEMTKAKLMKDLITISNTQQLVLEPITEVPEPEEIIDLDITGGN